MTVDTRYPGAGTNIQYGGATQNWTNPGNILTDNGVYAQADLLEYGAGDGRSYSNYISASSYGFSIPTTNYIWGIQLEVKVYCLNNHATVSSVILASGALSSNEKAAEGVLTGTSGRVGNVGGVATRNIPYTGAQYFSFGGDFDMWGVPWTPADLNSSAFYALFAAYAGTGGSNESVYVDTMRVTVTHSPYPPPLAVGYAGSAVDYGSGPGFAVCATWSNLGNALGAPDGTVASALMSASGNNAFTNWLLAEQFGLSIPSNYLITGIQADVWPSTFTASATDWETFLLKAGAAGGANRASGALLPDAGGRLTYGGPTDLWGATWIPADIGNTGFGLLVDYHNTSGGLGYINFDAARLAVFGQPLRRQQMML